MKSSFDALKVDATSEVNQVWSAESAWCHACPGARRSAGGAGEVQGGAGGYTGTSIISGVGRFMNDRGASHILAREICG